MYNGRVFLFTTVHTVVDVKKCLKRRSRVNKKNKNHLEKVWGKLGKVHFCIPRNVDDYNHWVYRVDLYDKNIIYYHLGLLVHITWITMFTHLLSVIRFNSYISFESYYKNQTLQTCYHS